MKRKIAALTLCLILTAFPVGVVSGYAKGAVTMVSAEAVTDAVKDETVYISLDPSGAVSEIDVVNRIETPRDGVYTDYGAYEKITNLTNEVKPREEGGAVIWQLPADPAGFYYQGKLATGEPPYLFSVKYYLDDTEISPADMVGKGGRAIIRVEAKPNVAAAEYFRLNYFCQAQTALDLNRCRNIEASGATGILSGKSMNLGYTVLPGKSASFEIAFDTDDFSFDGFTVTAMPFDQQNLTGIDTSKFAGDIDKMADGTQDLVDGTKDLKDGLGDLAEGVKKLSNGAGDAEDGLGTYKKGLKGYTDGVAQLSTKAKELSAAMNELAANGEGLKQGYAQLSAGLDGVLASFEPMSPPETAAKLEALRGQLTIYGAGLTSYIDGVSRLAGGMQAFAAGVAKLKSPGSELLSGLTEIIGGISKLTDGLSKTATEMNKLPKEIQKLIDGQSELHEGVLKAKDMFNEWNLGADTSAKPVSFVSDQNSPRSVQFIYKTPEIKAEKEKAQAGAAEEKKGFFEKLKDLFR